MTRDQHFMINKNVMERVLECSKINRDDIVLEIGAGTGSLTVMLAERAKRVIAIEIDEGFEDKLNEIAKKYGNIKVIIGNALEIIKKVSDFNKIISNPPYSILEPLLYLLPTKHFELCVLTIPTNFFKRITGNKTKLSLFVSSTFTIKKICDVSRYSFTPVPKTDSVIVLLKIIDSKGYKRRKADYIIREVFMQRDKKMKNALREALIRFYENVCDKKLTKREARGIISSLVIKETLLDKKVAEMGYREIKYLADKIKKLAENLCENL